MKSRNHVLNAVFLNWMDLFEDFLASIFWTPLVVRYTDDVGSHLAALDIAVHTSVAPEPFGRVLIEAMALRKPLVGAAEGAVPEIIDDGKTGLLFRPGNAKQLAHCILQLLDNPEKAAQMADRAYTHLTQNFHVDTNIRQTETLYASVMKL